MSRKKNISQAGVSKVKSFRKQFPSVTILLKDLLQGNKTALGRVITLLESTKSTDREKAREIIDNCLLPNINSIRIGITGPPGVGKSTFIENFGKMLTTYGNKVAVLAIDPSSSLTKGSILGDKTRMNELVKDPNAFVRPSPSREFLGGVAENTKETILVCEAAGYNIILIETVGVGQSEIVVHSMVDFFLVLQLVGAGDELQGIKRGIIEMADAIAINKADGDNLQKVKLAQREFTKALHLFPPKENGWIPKVVTCSAQEQLGLVEIWEMITQYVTETTNDGTFAEKRQNQNTFWLLQTVNDRLKLHLQENKKLKKQLEKLLLKVKENKVSPFKAADLLFQSYLEELK